MNVHFSVPATTPSLLKTTTLDLHKHQLVCNLKLIREDYAVSLLLHLLFFTL